MKRFPIFWKRAAVLLLLLPLLVACLPTAAEIEPTLAVPTTIAEPLEPAPTTLPTATLRPTELPLPTTTAVPTEPPTELDTHTDSAATATALAARVTPIATAVPATAATGYQVAFVELDDTLNVRAGAGVDFEVVGELAANEAGVLVTGAGRRVAGSTWLPVRTDGVEGWINGRFLIPMQPKADFCDDEAVLTLVEAFKTAVANRDGDALAQLVDAERGLRVRTTWWNPEVQLAHDALADIFSSATAYDWGVHDGSGDARVGSFASEIVPLFERDLLPASEIGCNVLLSGGSAGFVKLPESYEPLNYMTYYRPHGADQVEMDWGSWAIGVEKWGGRYTISFLVHFQWEI